LSTDPLVKLGTFLTLQRWSKMPCECPRPENASGDRECNPCKMKRAYNTMLSEEVEARTGVPLRW
jgi:hypothetical protein